MKFITTLLLVFTSLSFSFQDNAKILGDWNGKIVTPNGDLEVIFHLTEKDKALIAAIDSPMQNSYGVVFDEASFKENVLKLKMNEYNATYEGTLKDGKFTGKWKQSGQTFDLNLEKKAKK